MDDADLIRNGACDPSSSSRKTGDAAHDAILEFHSAAMNGGLEHALELDFEAAVTAEEAFRQFGARHLADLIREARRLAMPAVAEDGSFSSIDLSKDATDALAALDEQLPDDGEVESIVRSYLAAHPDEFDVPLRCATWSDTASDEIVMRYRDAAKTHGEAIEAGNARRANSSHDIIASIYRELRERGQQSRLLVLLDDPDAAVRAWAGAHSLEFAPDLGEPVLSALVRDEQGVVGFDAEMTLNVWRAGELRFP